MPVIDHKILAVAKASGTNVFVESGTCKGASLVRAIEAGIFSRLYSVEIQPELYNRIIDILPNGANRKIFMGSSAVQFRESIFPLCGSDDKIFFWLDGHFSAGPTGGSHLPCPLLDELECIKKYCPTKDIVIAIDDTDDFGRSDPDTPGHNWPSRVEVEKAISMISQDFYCLDYSGLGTTKKLNRGVLIYTTQKTGMYLMNRNLCWYSLMLRKYLLDMLQKLKKRYRAACKVKKLAA